MGFKFNILPSAISADIDNRAAELVADICEDMAYIGEECVNAARMSGDYTDRTGNLRSSVGYGLIKDGVVVRSSNFEDVKPTADKGHDAGLDFLDELAAKRKGICLAIVAGMEYSAAVQSKGYNVLYSAELLGEKRVNEMIHKLKGEA